jgi:hypothetical protein
MTSTPNHLTSTPNHSTSHDYRVHPAGACAKWLDGRAIFVCACPKIIPYYSFAGGIDVDKVLDGSVR